MSVSRLDIRNKCLTVKQNDGCLFIKETTGELGYEHLLCVSGDERVLADAFDEYLATDVFSHYVKCRDINVLRNVSNSFDTGDVLGLEFNFIHTDPGESTTLSMTTDSQTANIVAKVDGTAETPVFEFGDGNNTIQFTEASTKRVKIGEYWYEVTFIEFKTAVFTIDRVEKFLFPEGSIAVMDELTSEIVYENTDVQHVPTVIAKIDELMGELVYRHDDIPVIGSAFKVMIDELVAELVYEDGSLDVVAPYNITVCDQPNESAQSDQQESGSLDPGGGTSTSTPTSLYYPLSSECDGYTENPSGTFYCGDNLQNAFDGDDDTYTGSFGCTRSFSWIRYTTNFEDDTPYYGGTLKVHWRGNIFFQYFSTGREYNGKSWWYTRYRLKNSAGDLTDWYYMVRHTTSPAYLDINRQLEPYAWIPKTYTAQIPVGFKPDSVQVYFKDSGQGAPKFQVGTVEYDLN